MLRSGRGAVGLPRDCCSSSLWQAGSPSSPGEPVSTHCRAHAVRCRTVAGQGDYTIHLLADEKHVYGAKVEVVKEWEGRQPVISRMLTGIKL